MFSGWWRYQFQNGEDQRCEEEYDSGDGGGESRDGWESVGVDDELKRGARDRISAAETHGAVVAVAENQSETQCKK